MSNGYLSYLKEKNTTWFNPCNGLIVFWEEYSKLKNKLNREHRYVWTHRDLKKAKEIYATSIIAKVMEQQEQNRKWWISKPKNDPPDGLIGTLVVENGINKMYAREIEVVEHISGEIFDTIKNKLSSKQYEPNTILVCYISNGGMYNLKTLSDKVIKEETSLEHIFLVFTGQEVSEISKSKNDDDFVRSISKLSLIQIKPIYSVNNIDRFEVCKNWSEGKEANFFINQGFGKEDIKSITLENPPKLFED